VSARRASTPGPVRTGAVRSATTATRTDRVRGRTTASSDAAFATGSAGLTNARTRIVGSRTGLLADGIIVVVRVARAGRMAVAGLAGRLAGVITPLGWTLFAIIPLALITGYSVNWVELVVVGWAAVVLSVVAALYLVGRTSVTIDLRLAASRVVVGDTAVGEIVVSNPRAHRVLGANVEIPVGEATVAVTLPSLGRDAHVVHSFAIPTTARGVIPVGPVRTVRADPVGLVRREVIRTQRADVYVHPRTIGIPSTSTGFVRDLEGIPTRDLTSSDVSFHALREYQPGDEQRSIHWKSTAKTGRYMVRQFEETRRSHLVIALSLAEADYASAHEFEMAVSVTGSLGARAIRDARSLTVVVGESTPEFAKRRVFAIKNLSTITRSRLLDDLAVVASSETALGIADVARVAAERVSGISVAFLVCGSLVTPSDLRVASTKFPPGVEVVAIVCDPEHVPGLRRVAGLSVLTIGYLEDLKKSLSRSAAA